MAEDNLKKTLDEVTGIVDDAIRTGNFTELSSKIGECVGNAVGAFAAAGKAAADGFAAATRGQEAARRTAAQMAAKRAAEREAAQAAIEARKKEEERADRYFVRPPELTGSVMMTVLGAAGTVIFGLLTLIVALGGFILGGAAGSAGASAALTLTGVLSALSIVLLIAGRRATVRTRRFKAYRMKLLPKLYADVKDLAREMQLPEQTVISDLTSFTKKGMIREGHFDNGKTTFIASNELYDQYRESVAREQIAKRAREEEQSREASRTAAVSPEVQALLRKGNDYITRIRSANEGIPDEVITAKLDRTEQIVRKIFDEVEERPELAKNLNMFMNYYLPTTTKLLDAYREMDGEAVQGSNIQKAKQEISSSLDTINSAFETLLDSFFRDQAMDVASDVNVMKMMMKQEGLTTDDMTAMREREARRAQQEAAKQAASAAKAQDAGAAAEQTAGAAQAAGVQQAAGGAQAQAGQKT